MRYYSLNRYFRTRFGCPVAKISLDAGLSCPNRDGTLSRRGCIFCDEKGSGTGAARSGLALTEQIDRGLARLKGRADKFVAYFQAFTNTYAPPQTLKEMWDLALAPKEVVGLSIGTRPDCLTDETLDLLEGYARDYEVWLELGLQSASDKTLAFINRGHTAADFARAVSRVKGRGIKTLAHVILGLPHEGEREILATADFIANLKLDGVKIHSLYVSSGTELARLYRQGNFQCLTQEEYTRLAVGFLEAVPSSMVIHRMTGDPDPARLVAPDWSRHKHQTIAFIRQRLEELDTWQGRKLGAPRPDQKINS
ncbi:MAG: TIGR01212 family radical SAM protein [Deltaproteobacteria bacterium]|nr:TIGR01212 family radical SAM protein [Deltaproteobacteria bacterium]